MRRHSPFKALTPAANQKLVEAWKHPEGTPVVVTKDDGEQFHTRTMGPAYLMGGHTAMIFVAGISGGYALERVRPEKTK